jgi:hypothetical protein
LGSKFFFPHFQKIRSFYNSYLLTTKPPVMESNDQTFKTPRREFLGALATGAVAMGIGTFATPLAALAAPIPTEGNMADDPDAWFNKIKGKHRVVFDCIGTNEVFPFAWPAVFMMTNEATGTPVKDQGIDSSIASPGHSLCHGRQAVGQIPF